MDAGELAAKRHHSDRPLSRFCCVAAICRENGTIGAIVNISRLIFPVCVLIAGALSYYSQTKGSGLTVTKIGDGYTSLLAMMTERLAVTLDL